MNKDTRKYLFEMFYRFHNLDEREKTQFILDLFLYQSSTNLLYEKFINYLNIDPNSIKNIEDIPFLQVSFYKTNVSKYYYFFNNNIYY